MDENDFLNNTPDPEDDIQNAPTAESNETNLPGLDQAAPNELIQSSTDDNKKRLLDKFEKIVPKDYGQFVGRAQWLGTIMNELRSPDLNPLLNVVGLGGLGKSAIIIQTIEKIIEENLFKHVVWTSAKKQIFKPASQKNIEETGVGTYTFESLLNDIAKQTDVLEVAQIADIEEKKMRVSAILEYNPTLVIMDNMETVPNREEIVEQAYSLLSKNGRSKILITSRFNFESDKIRNQQLQGFQKSEGLYFIDVYAGEQQVNSILQADDSQKERIFKLTGGAPLALKLVIGRAELSNVNTVLDNLEDPNAIKYNNNSYDFYRFMYQEAWKELAYESKAGLVYLATSAPAIGASVDAIKFSLKRQGMSESQIDDGLRNLTKVSLINKIEKNNKTRYTMHLLTYNFVWSDITKLKRWDDDLGNI